MRATQHAIVVETNTGINGEFLGGMPGSYAQLEVFAGYLIGKNPLHREQIYNDVKRALRKYDRLGIGPVDITLWDFAGKYRNAPVYELLGGAPRPLPAYASTYFGDRNGGLDSPQAFADFAVQCKEMGYPAFKIHGWGQGPLQREIDTVHAVRRRVGDEMDLMLDP
ncbi:MAG: mandelate racemase, partial [SAR202 cluster bacterium]|nr:mandelate racemase [SAR202 cluster bacterium]